MEIVPVFSKTDERLALGIILTSSAAAVGFLLWLLYLHHPPPELAQRWIFLPRLNAILNGLSAVALCVGLYFIKHRNRRAHRNSMLLAFAFSSLFLISYIVNHGLRGDTLFPGEGTVRTVYLSIFMKSPMPPRDLGPASPASASGAAGAAEAGPRSVPSTGTGH